MIRSQRYRRVVPRTTPCEGGVLFADNRTCTYRRRHTCFEYRRLRDTGHMPKRSISWVLSAYLSLLSGHGVYINCNASLMRSPFCFLKGKKENNRFNFSVCKCFPRFRRIYPDYVSLTCVWTFWDVFSCTLLTSNNIFYLVIWYNKHFKDFKLHLPSGLCNFF